MKPIRKELKIKTIVVFAVAALMLPLLLTASPASATTVADCTVDIKSLETNTTSITYTNLKDQDALVGKLENAIDKLTLGKLSDAIQKLTDYQNKVLSLISQGKIAPSADGTVTPQDLVNGADAAITCIQHIAT